MPLNPPFRSIDDSRDMAPPHPGEILREDMLPHFNVTARELARHIGVSPRALDIVLDERAPITTRLAKRLGKALGQDARYWLALQLQYDLWHGSLSAMEQPG